VGLESDKGWKAQKQIEDIKSQIQVDALNFETEQYQKRLAKQKEFFRKTKRTT
jgi:hypothetical protein